MYDEDESHISSSDKTLVNIDNIWNRDFLGER